MKPVEDAETGTIQIKNVPLWAIRKFQSAAKSKGQNYPAMFVWLVTKVWGKG